jgi:4-hydroxy-2-oxoheptanedioate aldolase
MNQNSMRPSRVLRGLRAGRVVSCFKVNLSDARVVELAAQSGFDCIWTDMEHTATDWEVVEKQIWAAKGLDVDVMVRVARGGYSDYIRPLELDAAGIMVPHIMDLDDAKRVIRMTRFHPIGRRPVDGGNADGLYTRIDMPEYIAWANEQRFVVVQIEDPEPLEDLDAIAALEGIDMLFFGPGDFSHGIGAPGQWDHPKIAETRRRVAEACAAHGKFAGTPGNVNNVGELIEMGYRFIPMGADVVGLCPYCDSQMAAFKAAASPINTVEKAMP